MALPKFKEISSRIPSVEENVRQAVADVLGRRGASRDLVKASFSDYLEDAEATAFQTYLRSEREAWDSLVGLEPVKLGGDFEGFYVLFQSIAQSRRARAGSVFEDLLRTLFRRLGYPFEEQAVVDGKPDFILPTAAHYRRNPRDAIIFTAKRTLRERWRQVATEGTRGLGQYLATIDDNVTGSALQEMMENRIYLVVPKALKTRNSTYEASDTVISFEDFFEDHVDPAVARWRRAGVIE